MASLILRPSDRVVNMIIGGLSKQDTDWIDSMRGRDSNVREDSYVCYIALSSDEKDADEEEVSEFRDMGKGQGKRRVKDNGPEEEAWERRAEG